LYHDAVFGRELQGIPKAKIQQIYRPVESLERLNNLETCDPLQQDVVTFAQLIEEAARVKINCLGISGSVQVNLHGPTSDIDLIVYGKRAGRAVQLALRRAHLAPDQGIVGYHMDTYRSVYNLRWSGSGIPIEKMILVDGLKSMHGIFGGHHYFVRAVFDWEEIDHKYGDLTYNQIGYAKARCVITQDREGVYTPCRYEIDNVEFLKGTKADDIREIVSFRGRFCEQVRQDEEVIVQGTLEKVIRGKEKWVRFLLGDRPTDILIPSSLL
jgi:predicted nucleotidyltransferase